MLPLSITLAQLNPTVGDVDGNCALIRQAWDMHDCDLVVCSELVVTGYPPEDLVLKPAFIASVRDAVEGLIAQSKTRKAGLLISAPWVIDGALYNAALLIYDGALVAAVPKYALPNYGVFDEKRYFKAGPLPDPVAFKGHQLGILTCEDMWIPDVAGHLKTQGAEILLSLNASPFEMDKSDSRFTHAKNRVAETGLPLVYVNQVGGQDELVFDGGSFVMDAAGVVVQTLPQFEEATQPIKADCQAHALDDVEVLYKAVTLGLQDYVRKNGFSGVLLGLSGGIDSALSAVIAVDALGADAVQCVMMPSRYTSQDSLDDAAELADNLGVQLDNLDIHRPVEAFHALLPKDGSDIMFQNLQSRTRGMLLMALSNDNGKMVLSTGNKSEMAVGYATLYGDMCGGFNALKDLYKGQVYALSEWRNTQGAAIPERIITKAPTAELKDNQTDQDSLPPYDDLDQILECLIEHDMDASSIAARGLDLDVVKRISGLLNRAEYKRRQAPPGVKVTSRAFGRDRRYPITNKFIEK